MGQLINIIGRLANSRSPDPKLVKLALHRVIADIDVPASPPGATAQMEQQALPKSYPGKNNVLSLINSLKDAFSKGDDAGFERILDKLQHSAKGVGVKGGGIPDAPPGVD
jgi:hypothetical protein